MKLDYNTNNGAFILTMPAGAGEPIMAEHGFDKSLPLSVRLSEDALYTHQPYAAVAFAKYATPAAAGQLDWIIKQVDLSWALDSDRHIDVPGGQELWPFQRGSVAYALERQNALVGDEPGLGKTPIAISVANELQARRNLIVCPASIRLQWMRRIRQWSTIAGQGGRVYPVLRGKDGIHENVEWLIVSFELARNPAILRALTRLNFDLLIIDEAHNAKTIDSRRTRALFGYHDGRPDDGESDELVTACLAERAQRILALTGTPLPNRPREAYVLARGLCWDAIDWLSENAFNERFNPQRKRETKNGKVWIDEAEGRAPELQARLRANFMVRHLKREVMPQLKFPVYDLVYLEETGAIRAALKAESLLGIDPDDLSGADIEILGEIATVRRMMGEAMAPGVANYARTVLDGGEGKIALFAWHVSVLDILQAELQGYGGVRVDGSLTPAQKDGKVMHFIANPDCRIILGNILSLGVGVDGLQEVCSHGIMAEADWVPANNIQPFDRLDRGGQRAAVLADICVVAGSMAERVLATALRKGGVIHKALDARVA